MTSREGGGHIGMDQQIEMRDGYLYAKLSGIFHIDEAKRLYSNVQEEADRRSAGRVLIDCLQLRGVVDIADRFQYGAFVAEQQLASPQRRSRRTAYVGREPPFDKKRFGEMVATNRMAKVKRFESAEAALRWLGVDADGQEGAAC